MRVAAPMHLSGQRIRRPSCRSAPHRSGPDRSGPLRLHDTGRRSAQGEQAGGRDAREGATPVTLTRSDAAVGSVLHRTVTQESSKDAAWVPSPVAKRPPALSGRRSSTRRDVLHRRPRVRWVAALDPADTAFSVPRRPGKFFGWRAETLTRADERVDASQHRARAVRAITAGARVGQLR